MNTMIFLNWVAALFSIFAAIFWMASGFTRVAYVDDGKGISLVSTDDKTGKETDILENARRQTKWCRWATGSAAVAAASQAIFMMIQ
jgi:hypothetical protein